MSRDLTNLYIDETFQYLTQISGSNQDILLDGIGNRITELQVTASNATSASYALTASYALNSVPQVSASYAVSSSQAENSNNIRVVDDTADFDNAIPWVNGGGTISPVYSQTTGNFTYNPAENTLKNVSLQGNASTATSASYALTASYALNAGGGGFPYTGSALITGSLGVTGSLSVNAGTENINLTSNKTNVYGDFRQEIAVTGSSNFAINAVGVGGLLMSVGGYDLGGGWNSTANMTFYGADQAFFSAQNDFYIKNIYNDTGSITVWSENDLTLRGDTGVVIYGGDPFTGISPQETIDLQGKAFANTIASNINGFSTTINRDSTVKGFVRAYVEDPMIVNPGKTVSVESGATLRVIEEFGSTAVSASYAVTASHALNAGSWNGQYNGDAGITGSLEVKGDLIVSESNSLNVNGHNQFHYGAFYDTTSQSGSADTAHYVKFNTQQTLHASAGVTMVSNTQATFTEEGTYDCILEASLTKTTANAQTVSLWIRKNGIDVPASRKQITLQGSGAKVTVSFNWVQHIEAGDYIEFMWSTPSANIQFQALGTDVTPTRPSAPSAYLNVNQVG